MDHFRFGGRTSAAFVLIFLVMFASVADAQLGVLTATVGPAGQIVHSDGSRSEWRVGQQVGRNDRIITGEECYAMLFFAGGQGPAALDFDGAIVVELDQNTEIEIRRRATRRAPIDLHVRRGGVRAFFDAGEHKDFILLSTPLGELQVTGSVIYATHDLPNSPGTVLGSFDSQCIARMADGSEWAVSRSRKLIFRKDQQVDVLGLTVGDLEHWESIAEKLNFASALAYRSGVRSATARRTWVGEYVVSSERLEEIGSEGSRNIPSQEPELVASAATTTARSTEVTSRDSKPRLRTAGAGRSAGDDEGGFGRETLLSSRGALTPTISAAPRGIFSSGATLRSSQVGRSASVGGGSLRNSPRGK